MEYVIEVRPVVALHVRGTRARFPVNRIFCVGRNYAEHAREMGQETPEPPFFFMKPASAVVPALAGEIAIRYPSKTSDFQHEVELVVAIGRAARAIAAAEAAAVIFGYGIGLDMTRRDLQAIAKDKGRPWEFGKAFSQSAPMGALRPVSECGHPASGEISLAVNDEPRQRGDLAQMTWSPAQCIAQLSEYEALAPGDLVMTGTPAGVGPVVPGDRLLARIEGLGELRVTVREQTGETG